MAEFSIPRVPNPSHHYEPFTPAPPVIYNATISPFLRGPMYTAYADLRDWKLRMKKAGLSPSTPIPLQVKRPASMAPKPFRSVPEFSAIGNDSMKMRPPVFQRFDLSKTPSPPVETQWFDRSKMVSPPLNQSDGPPRAGSGRVHEFLLTRSFSSFDDSTSRNKEEGKSGRSANKGIFRKTFAGFRGPAKTNTSIAS